MARFWNHFAAMRPDSLHYKVLMHDIKLAIVEGRETFSGTLMQQLKKLGYYIADHVRFDRALQIHWQNEIIPHRSHVDPYVPD
jgi:hypothetical protein